MERECTMHPHFLSHSLLFRHNNVMFIVQAQGLENNPLFSWHTSSSSLGTDILFYISNSCCSCKDPSPTRWLQKIFLAILPKEHAKLSGNTIFQEFFFLSVWTTRTNMGGREDERGMEWGTERERRWTKTLLRMWLQFGTLKELATTLIYFSIKAADGKVLMNVKDGWKWL